MKRLTCLFILILLLLTGCSAPPQTIPAKPGDTAPPVITLWYSYQGAAAKGLQQLQQDLNKSNSGYVLQLVYVPAEEYQTKLTRALAADKGPDIFLVSQEQLPDLYVAGSIQTLENKFDDSTYFKACVDALSFNGSLLAVPQAIRVPLLAYNKDLISNPPQSIDQLSDGANKATQGRTVGLAGDLSNMFLSSQIYSAYGGQFFASDQKPNLSSAENQAFLQEITGLGGIKAGTYDPGSARELMGGGTTPYALLDSSELNDYKSLGKNLGFMGMPGPGGKEGKPYVRAQGYVVSANCNFPKEAAAAAVYLTSAQALAKYSIPQGEFPANPAAYDQDPLKGNNDAQLVKHLASIGSGYPLDSRSNLVLPILSQAVKDVLNGAAPSDAAVNAQNKALKALGYDQP